MPLFRIGNSFERTVILKHKTNNNTPFSFKFVYPKHSFCDKGANVKLSNLCKREIICYMSLNVNTKAPFISPHLIKHDP